MIETGFWLVIAFLLGATAASFLGYWYHKGLHTDGFPGHKGHDIHHLTLYPPEDLVSVYYRKPPSFASGTFLFAIPSAVVCLPLLAFGGKYGVAVAAGLIVFALVSDMAHDDIHIQHLTGKAARLHFIHHHDMDSNFGIVEHVWDRVFGSYRESR